MGAIAQVFFWREKSGPGRRIKYPIGYLKYPKSPNPTLQPCWVHPTKSQNSLQEVDVQLIHPHSHRLISTHIGYFPNRRAVWREMGRKMSDFFSENLMGTRSRVDLRTHGLCYRTCALGMYICLAIWVPICTIYGSIWHPSKTVTSPLNTKIIF